MRRSLAVLGATAVMLILCFVALFASGGRDTDSSAGSLPALTTTTTIPTPTTVTTITNVKAIGSKGNLTLTLVSVPNVVGMTLGQASASLSAVGLGAGKAASMNNPNGESATGTILGQFPSAGSQAPTGLLIQLTISGY